MDTTIVNRGGRVLAVLDSAGRPLSLHEIQVGTGINRQAICNVLDVLGEREYVSRAKRGKQTAPSGPKTVSYYRLTATGRKALAAAREALSLPFNGASDARS